MNEPACKMILELQSDIQLGSFELFQLALASEATSQRHPMCTAQGWAGLFGLGLSFHPGE